MKIIYKIDDLLEAVEKLILVVLFWSLILLIFFNIISRNLFHISFQKIFELSPALVLWLALLGSTLALKYRRHIKLEVLLRFCSIRIRFIANIAASAFGMVVMGILARASLEFVKNEVGIFGPWGWVSVIFPLFFVLSFFRYFVRMVGYMNESELVKP